MISLSADSTTLVLLRGFGFTVATRAHYVTSAGFELYNPSQHSLTIASIVTCITQVKRLLDVDNLDICIIDSHAKYRRPILVL